MIINALHINVITHSIDKKYSCINTGKEDYVFEINLFFRPGHYDTCYSKEELLYIENTSNK